MFSLRKPQMEFQVEKPAGMLNPHKFQTELPASPLLKAPFEKMESETGKKRKGNQLVVNCWFGLVVWDQLRCVAHHVRFA